MDRFTAPTRGKYCHIRITFFGNQAQYGHVKRWIYWRTWVVHTLRMDTVIILVYVTNGYRHHAFICQKETGKQNK